MDNCLELDGGEGDHLVCQDGCVGRVELVDWEWGNREVKTGVRRRAVEYLEREEMFRGQVGESWEISGGGDETAGGTLSQDFLAHVVAGFMLNSGVVTDLVTVAVEIALGFLEIRMAGIVGTGGLSRAVWRNMFSFRQVQWVK